MQNSVPSVRITSLYLSQPSSVVFGYKTATFGPEQQVSMGTRPLLSFCAWKTAWLAPELLSLWVPALICGITYLYWSQTSPVVLCMQYSVISSRITCLPSPHLWFFDAKTATFGQEQQVSMYPRDHLSLSACKTAWLAQEALYSPYGSQPSSVVFACKRASFGPE